MTIPNRRLEDIGGGISHADRHAQVDIRISTLERRDVYILLLLMTNTMLTAGDIITKIGPIIHTFSGAVSWLILWRPF